MKDYEERNVFSQHISQVGLVSNLLNVTLKIMRTKTHAEVVLIKNVAKYIDKTC